MYTLIEHKKLDAAAASITFSNIPQTFTDLLVVASFRSATENTAAVQIWPNGSSSNLSARILYGNGSSATSVSSTSYLIIGGTNEFPTTANTFSNMSVYIPNYAGSSKKSISIDGVSENNATTAFQGISAALWDSTSAITSLQFLANTGNLGQHSSATLYGVNRTSAIGKPKAIGGNITYSNGYWVHTFTGSGTFVAQQDLEIDALVVAGGGGGATDVNGAGGGGGAGGFLPIAPVTIPAGSYPIAIGAGGSSGNSSGYIGSSGQSSSAFGYTAIGGGRGGSERSGSGPQSGGSGGGGSYPNSGASGTAGQGNAGGSGNQYNGAAGGGGAGAIGQDYSGGTSGAGGAGAIWNGNYYAGGGGGGDTNSSAVGAGGLGGGGTGGYATSISVPAQSGTSNTGGGGGGSGGFSSTGQVSAAGSGGSGVVIVRYRAD